MRIDNYEPEKVYKNFWDWLSKEWHVLFIAALLIGYLYYRLNTTEVEP